MPVKASKITTVVKCPTHGRAAGYGICDCVLAGAAVASVIHPEQRADRIGEIICGREKPHKLPELKLICQLCAVIDGYAMAVPAKF